MDQGRSDAALLLVLAVTLFGSMSIGSLHLVRLESGADSCAFRSACCSRICRAGPICATASLIDKAFEWRTWCAGAERLSDIVLTEPEGNVLHGFSKASNSGWIVSILGAGTSLSVEECAVIATPRRHGAVSVVWV
jgi:hypothetical protein